MLRRRPAAVYEVLAEDELLERERKSPRHAEPPPAPGNMHRREARRTLLVALSAAGLVGFAVWELLGLASESSAGRPPLTATTFAGAARQERDPAASTPRSPVPPPRPRAARRARRATAITIAARPSTPDAQVPAPFSVAVNQPPMPLLSPPSAEQEFGFER